MAGWLTAASRAETEMGLAACSNFEPFAKLYKRKLMNRILLELIWEKSKIPNSSPTEQQKRPIRETFDISCLSSQRSTIRQPPQDIESALQV